MIANHMYNIELPNDETFLSTSKNIMMIATIFNQAITKHIEIYGKRDIPLTFLEFYINEIKNYDYMYRKQTKEFFDEFEQFMPNMFLIAEIYSKSFFANCKNIISKNGEKFLKVDSTIISDFFPEMIENSSKEITSAITNLKKITQHINNSDEIISFQSKYEHFMISKIISQSEFDDKYYGNSKFIVNIYNDEEKQQVISAARHAERLTSERINFANQKGRITKIVIPKLKLPTAFPKSSNFSRYNSKYRVRNFVSPSRMILILNDLKVNGVSYSSNFVNKRKAIIEQNMKY